MTRSHDQEPGPGARTRSQDQEPGPGARTRRKLKRTTDSVLVTTMPEEYRVQWQETIARQEHEIFTNHLFC